MTKKMHQYTNESISNDALLDTAIKLRLATKSTSDIERWKQRKLTSISLMLFMPWMAGQVWAAPLPGGSLDPLTIPKYVAPLYVPPPMPKSELVGVSSVDYYKIAARQIKQQILPKTLPKTTVWAYGSTENKETFHTPSFTIEAKANRPVRVKWINNLKDAAGKYLPHLLPIDQTIHWANPGGVNGPDSMGMDPLPYTGPVPLVTHLHGSHVVPGSDGYPESWVLPAASNIPANYASKGSHWTQISGVAAEPGAATYQYSNDQRATQMWFHDHTLGMTRSNIYTGLVGMYMLRGGATDLWSTLLPKGDFEIPLLIQDRAFNANGSLFYPGERAFFEGLAKENLQIPFIPANAADGKPSDVSPIWNPEFFSNVMLVNGNSWPQLNVEQRRYRFRILNGSDSRFMILKIAGDPTAQGAPAAVPFWVIGGDGGFQQQPAQLDSLLIGPAERIDVIVDFTNIPTSQALYLINEGPDSPYGGGKGGTELDVQNGIADYAYSDPATTGQVMKLTVVPRTSNDRTIPPKLITALLPPELLGNPTSVRQVSVNEMGSETVFADYNTDQGGSLLSIVENLSGFQFGPTVSMLGTLNAGTAVPLPWMDPITETPSNGSTEIWEINNFTEDAHPIHMHLVEFQVINREPLGVGAMPLGATLARGPEPWEFGSKDTVIAYPGEVTRVKAKFDRPGVYVWHCHILSHEDNDMMRPICVGDPANCPPVAPKPL